MSDRSSASRPLHPSRVVLVATTNQDKLREIHELLAGVPIELKSLKDLPPLAEPDETGTTFAENARIKALYYAAHTPWMTVAEDSGLVVDALDGEPGIHSARFMRSDASYPERFAEIQRRLAAHPERGRAARFMCALAVAQGAQVLYETTGVVEGEVATDPRGTGGFGYDPIFFYPPYGRTLAQVSAAEKLAVAHRGQAFRALAGWLQTGVL